jgi:Protein of unknown function (DUF3307)
MFLIKLLLAHFIGDFVFQNNTWVKHKEIHKIKSKYLYWHLLLHFILLLLAVGFQKKYVFGIFVICISHLVIDIVKLYRPIKNNRWLFFWDQIAHLAMLFWFSNDWQIRLNLQPYLTFNNLLLLLAIVVLTSVTSIILKVIFSFWENDKENIIETDSSLKNAGKYIGMLERLLVFAFIVLNHWEAIGFLLAAKSVFRFGDLTNSNDRKLTEYILIGTLLSFGIAIFVGVFYMQIVTQS